MEIPSKIIDVHSHIFNLNYMPVRGIMISRGVPAVIALGVEKIFLALTSNKNYNQFNKGKFIFDENSVDFETLLMQGSINEIAKDIGYKTQPETFFDKDVAIAMDHYYQENQDKNSPYTKINRTSEIVNEEWLNEEIIPDRVEGFLTGIFNKIEMGKDHLRWFFFMTLSEEKIVNRLYQNYSKVDSFIVHMLDTRHYFQGETRYSFEEILSRMEDILKSNNKLIGFAPYNPKEGAPGLRKLMEIIDNESFHGVKFYPPLGYRPIGNDSSLLDTINKAFFKECIVRDLPVFTHCTPTGFQSNPEEESGKNSDPLYWEDLLKIDEFCTLRLCLGHAGGEEGWFDEIEEDGPAFPLNKEGKKFYSEKVYELCTTYENVYCEIGFLEHIHSEREFYNFKKRLEHLFKLDSNSSVKFPFSSKIMYGSDWHVLFNHGIELNYDKPYLKLFHPDTSPILNYYIEEFFYKNAQDYLNITEDFS